MTDGRPSRRRARLAAALWVAFGFVIWNVVFDTHIRAGMHDYLVRQTMYELGRGPFTRIDDVMVPATAGGLRAASVWGTLVAGTGLMLVAFADRRQPARTGTGSAPRARDADSG